MAELLRTRDLVILFKDAAFPVAVSDEMIQQGWTGGMGVRWVDSPLDEFKATYSDGMYGGFLLWGSDEPSDQYVSYFQQQLVYGYAIIGTGNWVIATSSYEKFTWDSRHGIGPPNVPIVYLPGQRVVFSNRGLWTNEDEWSKTFDPRGPNTYYVANVVQAPSPATQNFITLQTSI